MIESFREAFELLLADTSGKLVAGVGLLAVVVSAVISPVSGAVVAAALLLGLVVILAYALRQRALSRGPYEVLDETITWEFPDSSGKTAYVTKRQKVRFNYLTIALVEYATGDGELFADFDCNFGEELKQVSRADSKGSLIELRPERIRGEKCELRSRRTIRDGFAGSDEWMTFKAVVPSKKTELIFVFPEAVQNVRVEGPKGHGSRPAKDKELKTVGSAQVLTLKGRRYKTNWFVKVTWSW